MSIKKMYDRFAGVSLAYPSLQIATVGVTLVAALFSDWSMRAQLGEVRNRCARIKDLVEYADCSSYESGKWVLLVDLNLAHLPIVVLWLGVAFGAIGYKIYGLRLRNRLDGAAQHDKVHATRLSKVWTRAGHLLALANLGWLLIAAYLCAEAVVWSYAVG